MHRRLLFAVFTALFSLLLVEVGLRLVVKRRNHVQFLFGRSWYFLVPFDVPASMPTIARQPGTYRRYDAKLGWTLGENGAEPPLYFSDANGVRVTEAQHATGFVATRSPQVLCIGDSFTHGDEVKAEDSWPAQLEQLLGAPVVNLGVGGYGTDQAILRWRESAITARIVLLGLIEGDLERSTTPIYNFENAGLKSKPMFRFEGEQVRLANQPAIYGDDLAREFRRGAASDFFRLDLNFDARFFEHTALDWLYLYRIPRSATVWREHRLPPIYRMPGPRFDYAVHILEYAQALAKERNARLIVVLLNNNNTFSDQSVAKDPWQYLREALKLRAILFIDTTAQLTSMHERAPASVINATGVHYTPAANHKVAEIVAASLHGLT